MYKILSYSIGNDEESERKSYDSIQEELNELEKKGWSLVSSCWDDGGLGRGQASGVVVFLHK